MPDLQLYRAGNAPSEEQDAGLVDGRPDLVVEVVSPKSYPSHSARRALERNREDEDLGGEEQGIGPPLNRLPTLIEQR